MRQGIPVIADYKDQHGVDLTYFTSGGTGEGGDQYTGLDPFGRIVDQRWLASGATDLERIKYGYDRASNRQWRQNTVAGTGQDEYYTYDELYQVKTLDRGTLNGGKPGISGTPGWEEDWNYDPTGNWRGGSTAYLTRVAGSTTLNQNRSHNEANESTNLSTASGTAWPTPTHDVAGNMITCPRPLSLGNSFDLKWDAWNRLVEVKDTGESVVATYAYDGADRRVTKVTGGNTRHYYYSDQWQVLEERLDSSTSADRQFVWGIRSIDDLVLRDHDEERLYALHDAMDGVTAVIDLDPTVLERYGYDGFGTPRYMTAAFGSRGSSDYAWETLFDGYRYDLESGLYQVRHRALHTHLGRWLSRDSLGEVHGAVLYAYVRNLPVDLLDSLGLEAIRCRPYWTDIGDIWLSVETIEWIQRGQMTETISRRRGRPPRCICQECIRPVICTRRLVSHVQRLYKHCMQPHSPHSLAQHDFILYPDVPPRQSPREPIEDFQCTPSGPFRCSDWVECIVT